MRPLACETVFTKRHNSAFKGTGLQAYLQQYGINSLVIVGMQTEYCIETTVRVGFELGYELWLPESANSTFDCGGWSVEALYHHHLFDIMADRFAKVVPMARAEVLLSGAPPQQQNQRHMGQKIQAVKGMNDLLPVEQKDFKLTTAFWQAFEDVVTAWTRRYGYQQIRTPLVEQTGLFVRSIGEETDVVGKEMYTFADANDTLSLRPEGTASCLRAVVEHNLLYNGAQKLWYMGPMFRRERPQKGRYRQFHQVGVEALGFAGPDVDAEIIVMCADLWDALGIRPHLTLEINCLGRRAERATHRAALVAYLQQHEAILDEDGKRRLRTNPLRVLDTKNPALQEMADNAPRLLDYLDTESRTHYTQLKAMLDGLGIAYVENPRLVRGLDYYNLTVFEWVTDKLGAQATVCGGGRYDGLLEELGGKSAPSIGFAMGIERLLLLVREHGCLKPATTPDVYAMHQGEGAALQMMRCARELRGAGVSVLQHSGSQNLKTQMKKADATGARFALIIAQDELMAGTVVLKDLRGGLGQVTLPANAVLTQLQQWMDA